MDVQGRAGVRQYLVTAFCARLADEGVALAVVTLAVHRTGGAAQGAFVLTAWMAPHVLAAPLAGALAARARRPRLFHTSALGGFAMAIALLGFGVGRIPLPVVLAVAAVGGCCGPVVSGGMSSLVTRICPAGSDQDRAYAWDAVVYSAAAIAGPGVAGLAAGLSPAAAMSVMSVAAACAAALVAVLPLHPEPARDTSVAIRLRGDLASGLATVWRYRELRAITAATSLAFVGIGGLTTIAVLLGESRNHPEAGGLLMTAFATGALAGNVAIARARPAAPPHRLAVLGMLGTGIGLAAAAIVPLPLAAAAFFAIAGACDGLLLTATLRLRAHHAPPAMRTQVFTIGAGLKISAAAVGSALAGLATPNSGPRYLIGIAVLQTAAALSYLLIRRSPHRAARLRIPAPRRIGHRARQQGRSPGELTARARAADACRTGAVGCDGST
ncbi:MFS transporter [Kitasatospora sp. NPDC001175]|uniref:MFS transporter n=1 Tax=Kitasatospora sp. NPDC001175 TaxID=3157103 RepID=UPI003D06A8DA